MLGCLFQKESCPVFFKASQGEGKKDCQKAACSSDTKAKDGKKRQKDTTGHWSDAALWEGVAREGGGLQSGSGRILLR